MRARDPQPDTHRGPAHDDERTPGPGPALAARIVLTTAPDREVGERIARELVARSLAACVNCVPGVRSVYMWKGRIEATDEVLLVAKTTAERIAELERVLLEIHPYDVPECVVLEPHGVEANYLAWLAEATARPGTSRSSDEDPA